MLYLRTNCYQKSESPKKQQTLSQTFQRYSTRSESLQTDNPAFHTPPLQPRHEIQREQPLASNDAPPLQTSFETVFSEEADSVFSYSEDGGISSNNTSFFSDTAEGRESQFSGGTQLEQDWLNDVGLSRSFKNADATFSSPRELLDRLASHGPCKPVPRQLPADLPYWLTFEMYRVSLHLGCDVGPLYHTVKTACGTGGLNFAKFWKEIDSICQKQKMSTPMRSGIRSWTHEDNLYIDSKDTRSVYFSARLDFASSPGEQFLSLKLNSIDTDKSCRFHRAFGSDRFLVLDIPSLSPDFPKSMSEKLKSVLTPKELHERMFDWFGTKDLYIAGRTWRAFYTEPKEVPKRRRKEEGFRQKVHLFAVNGFDFASPTASPTDPGHRPLSLLDLVQWHIPIQPNKSSTDLKLYARMHLGLSKTTPTVILDPSEFIHVKDKKPTTPDGVEIENGEIMTDGCARISYDLARAVWKQMDRPDENVPSAFQARIGGAKGVWIVDYHDSHPEKESDCTKRGFWIEVSDSQLKIKPHPADRLDADQYQRTFEVVKSSHFCTPANLNTQLITILENRNVPRAVLRELMLEELREYYDSLTEAMTDGTELRRWRQVWHHARSAKLEIGWCGELPDAKEDELDILLESGFEPQSCRYMVKECLKKIIAQGISDREEKLWIKVPFSTNMFCVPDPLGVLEPGEIQVNFSQPVSDFPEWELENSTVLVARNPAHLPSDIQAVKFVYRPELRYIKDVAIFPIKGDFPLAGILSGGDYDGDTITAIWDRRITKHFVNATMPNLPTKRECSVVSKNKYVKDVFTISDPTEEQLSQFMRKCCSFNAISSRLGEVTKLLEKLVYTDSRNMATPAAMKLAALAGYLVDSAKAGDSFSTSTWMTIKTSVSNKYQLKPELPDYQDENATTSKRRYKLTSECVNILDHLKFDVAVGHSVKILTDFNNDFNPDNIRDADLKKPYEDVRERCKKSDEPERVSLEKILNDLKVHVQDVHREWQTRIAHNEHLRSLKDLPRDTVFTDYAQLVLDLSARIAMIEPLPEPCDIFTDFQRNGGGKGSNWARLRASYVYWEHYQAKMPWKLVGEELCWIKGFALRSRGVRVRPVVQSVREYMRMDLKRPRRVMGVEADLTGDDNWEEWETAVGSELV